MVKQTVIRTYSQEYMRKTVYLEDKLREGWIVKHITPLTGKSGDVDVIEYILEKEE